MEEQTNGRGKPISEASFDLLEDSVFILLGHVKNNLAYQNYDQQALELYCFVCNTSLSIHASVSYLYIMILSYWSRSTRNSGRLAEMPGQNTEYFLLLACYFVQPPSAE